MLRAIHFSPLPCSNLGQGVAISTTAFMLPRFFVQTPIFSVSPSSFSLSPNIVTINIIIIIISSKGRRKIVDGRKTETQNLLTEVATYSVAFSTGVASGLRLPSPD